MSLKTGKTIGLIAILVALIIAVGLSIVGCVTGISPVGWSGGSVDNGVLYVGSNEGRLVAINLTDDSRQWAESLKTVTPTGLFGCSTSGGGIGCGGGPTGVPIYGTPVVSGELAYIAGYNGKIYAYSTSNLATRWVYPREGNLAAFVGGIVIAQNKLFVGCSDGVILALDALTGDSLYQYKTGDKIWGTPAVDGDTLYIGSFDKKLYALNIADLNKKWEYLTQGSIIATPLVQDGIVYIGSFDRNIYAVNASNGTLKWQFTGTNWFWAQPVMVGDTLYAGCLDGFVYAINTATGEKIADFDLGSPVSSQPVIVGNYVVFVSRDGVIFKIDTTSREIGQVADLKTDTDGSLAAYQGIIYIHPQSMVIKRVNLSSGAVLPDISLQS